MTKQTYIIASVLSAAVMMGFIGLTAWEQHQKAEKLQQDLAQARADAETQTTHTAQLREQLAEKVSEVEELMQETEEATRAQGTLEKELRGALESKDVTISELQGKLTVNILDRILFDSGETVLKPEGEAVLLKIAQLLAEHPKRLIHVVGHTDNIPIRGAMRSRFPTNWELSTARATAAVRYLQEKAGVDPHRLGALGYGEFHPVAANDSAEGRSHNRRIALIILPEDLLPAEANPKTESKGETGTPAAPTPTPVPGSESK